MYPGCYSPQYFVVWWDGSLALTIFFLKEKRRPSKESGNSVPFMVRYPFDLLGAVIEVEQLTTNGRSDG